MEGNGPKKLLGIFMGCGDVPAPGQAGTIWQISEGFTMDTEYTRNEYISELYDRMKHDQKFRPVVKKLAEQGDAECVEAMVLWNAHVKRLRRTYASR